jgi:hypothetical protein
VSTAWTRRVQNVGGLIASVALAVPGSGYLIAPPILAFMRSIGLGPDAVTTAGLVRTANDYGYLSVPFTVLSLIVAFTTSRRLTGAAKWLVWLPSALALCGTLAFWMGMSVAFGI